MIYVDNAATTKMSGRARDILNEYMEKEYGNPSSLHSIGQKAKEKLEEAREIVASCIGSKAKEIYFTSGGSESNNQAILSAAAIGERKGKKHIVSTKFEHHAVLHSLEDLVKRGFDITLIDVDTNGIVDVREVEEALREDTCLVSIMYANNEIGTVQPIEKIGEVCRKNNILFHTDAVQAVGHIPVDVKEGDIDMLSISAHKFHGPKGIGALYMREGILITSIINGGSQERGKRAGTENVPAIMSMTVALEQSCSKMKENSEKIVIHRDKLIEGLSNIPKAYLNGDRYNRLPGNVSFCFEGIEGESLLLLLDQKGICASSGSACTSGSLEPSHVLLAIGRSHEIAHGSLRLSLDENNTEEEVMYIIDSVGEVVDYLRKLSPIWKEE